MRPVHRISGVLLSLTLFAGCQLSEKPDMSQDTSAAGNGSTAESIQAKFRLNPAPKQAYRVTLNIDDAPGPFAVIEGFAQYVAEDCTYMINKAAGVPAHPQKIIPIAYKKIDERTYETMIYIDAMQDEDYFGQGVCRWNLVVVSAELRATGAKGETRFFASLSLDSLLANKAQTKQHETKRYPTDAALPDFTSMGLDPITGKSFSLTFTSEAIAP
jgi:hypothetical protein